MIFFKHLGVKRIVSVLARYREKPDADLFSMCAALEVIGFREPRSHSASDELIIVTVPVAPLIHNLRT